MLINNYTELKNALQNKVILITGAGGGIGLETVKILHYMGAYVIIAENNKERLKTIKKLFEKEIKELKIEIFDVDLSSLKNISKLVNGIIKKHGFIDVLINNAIIINIGNIEELNINIWEKSYSVNFRAPLYLTQKVLPLMKNRNSGIIIFVSSSGAAPYMGAYEVFKTAQVELANTLFAEIENTDISVFTIGPGLVKTETAESAINVIAEKMGVTTDDFYKMNEKHILGAEEAGIGFALSIIKAKDYSGQEISSIRVLNDFGITKNDKGKKEVDIKTIEIINNVIKTYNEQYDGWKKMNIFERQWVLRDFKKNVGISADECHVKLTQLIKIINDNKIFPNDYLSLFEKLKSYFERQFELLQGFEKNPEKLYEHSEYLRKIINELEIIIAEKIE